MGCAAAGDRSRIDSRLCASITPQSRSSGDNSPITLPIRAAVGQRLIHLAKRNPIRFIQSPDDACNTTHEKITSYVQMRGSPPPQVRGRENQ